MTTDEQTYKDLITAFSHKLTIETSFYWKKATKRLVEVSVFDYALVSGDKYGYTSGLDPEEEREVKEAIIAKEKNQDTHLQIPRLTVPERIEIMNRFIKIQTDPNQKALLQTTLNKIIELQSNNKELLRKGFKWGFDMDNLIVHTKELSSSWIEFYRNETRFYVDKWLDEVNAG